MLAKCQFLVSHKEIRMASGPEHCLLYLKVKSFQCFASQRAQQNHRSYTLFMTRCVCVYVCVWNVKSESEKHQLMIYLYALLWITLADNTIEWGRKLKRLTHQKSNISERKIYKIFVPTQSINQSFINHTIWTYFNYLLPHAHPLKYILYQCLWLLKLNCNLATNLNVPWACLTSIT